MEPDLVISDRSKVRDMGDDEEYVPSRGRGRNMSGRVLVSPDAIVIPAIDGSDGSDEASEEPQEPYDDPSSGPVLSGSQTPDLLGEGSNDDSDATCLSAPQDGF